MSIQSMTNENLYEGLNEGNIIKEYEKLKKESPKAKVMVIGGTGVGKSSLINKIFGDGVAEIGHAKPTSRGIEKYEDPNRNIVIFDSEGYEIGADKQKHFNEEILSTIKREGIDVVWYCISAPNSRITDLDKKIIEKIKSKGVSLCVALTQCDDADEEEVEQLEEILKKEVKTKCFRVTVEYIEENNLGCLDLDEMVEWAAENIKDEEVKKVFVREQKNNLPLKRKEAESIINKISLGTAAVGVAPIPFSDAPLIMTAQAGMIAAILYVYDMGTSKKQIEAIISQMGLPGLMKVSGKETAKYLIAQAIKFIPGVGTGIGAVISAVVALVFTKALGHTVSTICYKIKEDEINGTNKAGIITAIDPEMFLKVFKEGMKKYGK